MPIYNGLEVGGKKEGINSTPTGTWQSIERDQSNCSDSDTFADEQGGLGKFGWSEVVDFRGRNDPKIKGAQQERQNSLAHWLQEFVSIGNLIGPQSARPRELPYAQAKKVPRVSISEDLADRNCLAGDHA